MKYALQFKHLILIFVSAITSALYSGQLNHDTLLIAFRDLKYRDITSFTLTNKYYNETINASFYEKVIKNKIPTLFTHQLSFDENLLNTFYRIQTKRYIGLIASNQNTFGLDKLFAIHSHLIDRLILRSLYAKYKDNVVCINKHQFRLNENGIKSKKFTFTDYISFFSDSQQLIKIEQTMQALPLLMEKIEAKEIDPVKELLQKHDQFDCINPWDLLEPLCSLDNYEIIKTFIEKDRLSEYPHKTISGTALEYAHSTGSFLLFTQLLQDPNIPIDCPTIASILKKCIDSQQIDWVRAIIQCNTYTTHQKQEIVNQRIHSDGSATNYKDYPTIFAGICDAATKNIIELLLPYGPKDSKEIALVAACKRKNKELVNWLLMQGADVNYQYEDGTMLFQRIKMNDTSEEIILSLLENADIFCIDKDGTTILHYALEKRLEKVAQFLIDKGADINCVDQYNHNLLHCAMISSNYCSLEILELLLQKGVTINQVDSYGYPPLAYAFYYPNNTVKQIIDLLVRYGANIHYITKNGNTALHAACTHKCPIEVLQYLIDNKLDVNAQNKSGKTPLHIACERNNLKLVEFLLINGAHVKQTDVEGKMPLCYCKPLNYSCRWYSKEGYDRMPLEIIELLLENGASIIYSMENAYDRLACMCLLKENEHTLHTIKELFIPLRPLLEQHEIDTLIDLAERKNNSETIQIFKTNIITKIQDAFSTVTQPESVQLEQNEPEQIKVSFLQKYKSYMYMTLIGAVLIYLINKSSSNHLVA